MATIPRPITKTIINSAQWGIPITDAVNANTTDVANLKTATATTAWTALPLQNGWATEGGFQIPQYRKVGDVVSLRGSLVSPSAPIGKNAFQLPTGYRPPAQLRNYGSGHQTAVGGVYTFRAVLGNDGVWQIEELNPTLSGSLTMGFLLSFSTI